MFLYTHKFYINFEVLERELQGFLKTNKKKATIVWIYGGFSLIYTKSKSELHDIRKICN